MRKANEVLRKVESDMKEITEQMKEEATQEIKTRLYEQYKVKSLAARRIEDHINY